MTIWAWAGKEISRLSTTVHMAFIAHWSNYSFLFAFVFNESTDVYNRAVTFPSRRTIFQSCTSECWQLSENTLTYNFMKFNKVFIRKKRKKHIQIFFCSLCTIWMQMNNHSLEKQNNWIKIKIHVKIFVKEERPTSNSLHTFIMLKMLLDFFQPYMLKLKTMTWAILNHCSRMTD